ncbi:MAG: hypothetical protein ACRDH7_03450 [Actinomycetota bacterium]
MDAFAGSELRNHKPGQRVRIAIVVVAFLIIGLVGFVDGLTSAYVAFSIFYLIPISLATWFGNRTIGIVAAVSCALAGLASDLWSINSQHIYAYTNVGLRLVLFILIAVLFARIHEGVDRDRAHAELEHEMAERLREINDMRSDLMRAVALDSREPLGDIYARVVTLGFDMPTLSTAESREVLNQVADASRRLSDLVSRLIDEDLISPGSPMIGPAR